MVYYLELYFAKTFYLKDHLLPTEVNQNMFLDVLSE